MFDAELVNDLATRARTATLSAAQSVRVKEVLRQFLNQPPVLARLRAAAERDGIPLTDLELAALSRVRKPRSKAQHGRAAKAPTEEDIELARGIVARVLAFWGNALVG